MENLHEFFNKKMKKSISEKFKILEEEITEEIFRKYILILVRAHDWFLPWDMKGKELSKKEYEVELKKFLKRFYPKEYDRIYK